MIIVRIKAGLGNQIFQYAIGRHLSIKNNTKLCLDTSWYYREKQSPIDPSRQFLLDQFAINAHVTSLKDLQHLHLSFNHGVWQKISWLVKKWIRKNHNFLRIKESHFHYDPQILNLRGNLYLTGIWQSEKYFKDIAPMLQNELTPIDIMAQNSAKEHIDSLKSSFSEVVSVHVRRGDYFFTNQQEAQSLISVDYYQKAMECFPTGAAFLFFSNSFEDIDWCKEHFSQKNIFFSENKGVLNDFVLMSACDHNIISNSTFSWWSAWLNSNPNKKVVAPRPECWFGEKYKNYNLSTLLPSAWERI
jgi:hypothetical protein